MNEQAEQDPPPVSAENEQKPWWRGIEKRAEGMRGNATMTFVDDEWDGSVADAFARARIGTQTGKGNGNRQIVASRVGPKNPVEQMGVKNILAIGERERQQAGQDGATPARVHRVLVGGVYGRCNGNECVVGEGL